MYCIAECSNYCCEYNSNNVGFETLEEAKLDDLSSECGMFEPEEQSEYNELDFEV